MRDEEASAAVHPRYRVPLARRLAAVVARSAIAALGVAGIALLFGDPIYALRLSLRAAPVHLPVPVAGIAARSLRDSWGAARGTGRHHEGIDIFAPRNREVIANTEGIVWSLRDNRLGGTVVWLLGPGRQLHYYAHLDHHSTVRVGDRIEPGDVLGYVGNTGDARTTPTHLHYGIYTATGAIDPFPVLTSMQP